MLDDNMKMVKRKAELALGILREGSIETVTERAALYSAVRFLFNDIEEILNSIDPSDYENFSRPYLIEQLRGFSSYAFYYLGLSGYDDLPPGKFDNVQHFALKFVSFIPSRK